MMIKTNGNCSLHKVVLEFLLKNDIYSSNVLFVTLKKAWITTILYRFLFLIISYTMLLHKFYIFKNLVIFLQLIIAWNISSSEIIFLQNAFDLQPLPYLILQLIFNLWVSFVVHLTD